MPFFRLGRHKNEKRPKHRSAATECQRMVGNPEAVEVRSADRAFPINVSAVSGAARRDCLSGMGERGSPGRFRYSRLKEAVLERCGYGV
jgi:hypothetical protein